MSTAFLIIGLVAIGIILALGFMFIGMVNAFEGGNDLDFRLKTYAGLPEEVSLKLTNSRQRNLSQLRTRLNSVLSVLASEETQFQLISANWRITVTEFMFFRIIFTVFCLLLGSLLTRNILSGIGLGVLAYFVPGFLLLRSISQRRMAFKRQLIDVLVLVNGAVKAGYSLQQAFDVVVRELKPPASEEFRRFRQEMSVGLSMSQALNNLSARMENEDLYLVVTAINIHSQVGGNLTVMLEAVTKTIRERIRLFGEIRVLTSQQRYNSYILTFLPVGFAAIMFILNPDYMMGMFKPGVTLCIPIGAVINIILGNIIVRRIARIDV